MDANCQTQSKGHVETTALPEVGSWILFYKNSQRGPYASCWFGQVVQHGTQPGYRRDSEGLVQAIEVPAVLVATRSEQRWVVVNDIAGPFAIEVLAAILNTEVPNRAAK